MANKKRLIWGDIAEERLAKLAEYYKGSFSGDAFERAAEEIANLPTVDAVVLPCKIGDPIWWINSETKTVECEKHGVAGFIITKKGVRIRDSCGGEDEIGTQYCYLTKEDAEVALAKMDGERNENAR